MYSFDNLRYFHRNKIDLAPAITKLFERKVFLETAVLLEIEKSHSKKENFDLLTISESLRQQWENGILCFHDFSDISEELFENQIEKIIKELFEYKFIPDFIQEGHIFKFSIDEDKNKTTVKDEVKTIMKTQITFKQLVLNTVKSFVDKKTTFSAHKITLAVRSLTNEGGKDLEITDLIKTTVPNVKDETYFINHEDVRKIVLDAFNLGTFDGYGRRIQSGYWEYFYEISAPTSTVLLASGNVSLGTSPTLHSVQTSLNHNAGLHHVQTKDKEISVISYVDGKRGKGQSVSLKQIQSALKRKPLQVWQIKNICQQAGYNVNVNTAALSKSIVS